MCNTFVYTAGTQLAMFACEMQACKNIRLGVTQKGNIYAGFVCYYNLYIIVILTDRCLHEMWQLLYQLMSTPVVTVTGGMQIQYTCISHDKEC